MPVVWAPPIPFSHAGHRDGAEKRAAHLALLGRTQRALNRTMLEIEWAALQARWDELDVAPAYYPWYLYHLTAYIEM